MLLLIRIVYVTPLCIRIKTYPFVFRQQYTQKQCYLTFRISLLKIYSTPGASNFTHLFARVQNNWVHGHLWEFVPQRGHRRSHILVTLPPEQHIPACRDLALPPFCFGALCLLQAQSAHEFKPLFIESSTGEKWLFASSCQTRMYEVFQGWLSFIVLICRDCSRSLSEPEFFYKTEGCRQFL